MYRAAERSSLRRDWGLFAGCLGLSLLALALPERWTGPLAAGIRSTALVPVIWLQQRGEEGRTSRARLRAAQAERDSATMLAQGLLGLAEENARLRRLLAVETRAPPQYIAAEVLHQNVPTDARTLLLSVGEREGARPFQPVVTGEGLVGVVSRAGRGSAIATTWAHPEFRVSAVTENGSVLGIVAASATVDPSLAVLEFRGVAYRDTVPDGTRVLTSGLGGVYPRGIPIGVVQGVRREELGWERVYRLVPLVNPGTVSHVLLLTTVSDTAAPSLLRDSVP